MNQHKFYKCNLCGNFVGILNDGGGEMTCCGEKMTELIPNSVEAATEKHIPVVMGKERLVSVEVGSVIHPSDEAHHIEFIYLATENGGQRKTIKVGDKPCVMFAVIDDKPVTAYAYCNLHGLWKMDAACNCGSDCGCDDKEHKHDCECK